MNVEQIHSALCAVQEKMQDSTNFSFWGICGELEEHLPLVDAVDDWLLAAFREWPEFSGRESYPVPSPESGPSAAFGAATRYEMWSHDHPYGAARQRLLAFLIERAAREMGR